jgi:hypothetical protein
LARYCRNLYLSAVACGICGDGFVRRADDLDDALPLFNSGHVRLLDNRRLVQQFASLKNPI